VTFTELVQKCYDQAVKSGWADKEVPIPEQIALLHSEASEALESWRNKEPLDWVSETGKPEGLATEYADIFIRLAHYAKLNGFDLEKAILQKLHYNSTRPYRHGGKRA
jgi:NTP pyrophosphatase (non-canonical NTP hydrolase)